MKKKRKAKSRLLFCDFGIDAEGHHWWRQKDDVMHGPFTSEAEARKDFETKVLGFDGIVEDRGRWDPAWDKKQ